MPTITSKPPFGCAVTSGASCSGCGLFEASLAVNSGAPLGKPVATGKEIRVPYSVVYDLEGDQIAALRIYMSLDEIIRQLES